jgi:hypothetical protein
LDGLSFNAIGIEEAMWMERAFDKRETSLRVKALNGDQPLGLMVFLFNLVGRSLKKISRMSFLSFMLEGTLRGASMLFLSPLFPRKPR